MIIIIVSMTITMLIMDAIWIPAVMKGLYLNHVASLLRMENGQIILNPLATAAVYLVMVLGLYVLVVRQVHDGQQALVMGAVAGLFSYGTFALTNQALFKDWSWLMTIADIAWGTVLMAVVAYVGFKMSS